MLDTPRKTTVTTVTVTLGIEKSYKREPYVLPMTNDSYDN